MPPVTLLLNPDHGPGKGKIPVLRYGWAGSGALGYASSVKQAKAIAGERGRVRKVERRTTTHAPGYVQAYYVTIDEPAPNPRRRTARARGEAAPATRGARLLSRNAVEIQYIHGKNGKLYVHEFKPGVVIEFLSDGSARLYRPDGKPLWKDF